jgi:radical SAM superfamily enzyme YgiQ (UPF0313 family)
MKVALVNLRSEAYSMNLPPLGLLYIGAVLEKHGFDVKIYDTMNFSNDFNDIKIFKPNVIGFTIMTTNFQIVREAIMLIKEINAFMILGGIHATALPEESLKVLDVDCVVIGEGEYTALELCQHLRNGKNWKKVDGIAYKEKNKIIMTKPRGLIENLDEIPFPARHLINFNRYLYPPGMIRGQWFEKATTVMTSRGCPYHCIFCGSHLIFGRKVRRRSIDNVINELKYLIDTYKTDGIWFIDDTFTVDHNWVKHFCKRLQKEKLNFKWGCQARVNTISEETLIEMKKAGCVQLDFGVESGSAKVLNALKKGTNPDMIRNAFKITKKVGINTMATFMLGNPEEKMEDLNETFSLAKEIKPDFVSFFHTTPFPGTELMEMAVKNGWIEKPEYSKLALKEKPIMKINLSPNELLKIRANFQNSFIISNYLKFFINLKYMYHILKIITISPKSFYTGLKTSWKSRVFDDFIFYLVGDYIKSRPKND